MNQRSSLAPKMKLADACIYRSNVEEARRVLNEFDIDINEPFDDGTTLLMGVVKPNEHGDLTNPRATLEMVRFLLQEGADPSVGDRAGCDSVQHASSALSPSWKDDFGDGYPEGWLNQYEEVLREIVELLEGQTER